MADLTITLKTLIPLHPVLTAVLKLTPPPTAKGRYALSRAGQKVEDAITLYAENEEALIKRCAVTREDGTVAFVERPDGRRGFDLKPELRDEYHRELAGLQAESVTLAGCRMITHAELGACPITGEQEKVLIAAGLLEDAEPA